MKAECGNCLREVKSASRKHVVFCCGDCFYEAALAVYYSNEIAKASRLPDDSSIKKPTLTIV